MLLLLVGSAHPVSRCVMLLFVSDQTRLRQPPRHTETYAAAAALGFAYWSSPSPRKIVTKTATAEV